MADEIAQQPTLAASKSSLLDGMRARATGRQELSTALQGEQSRQTQTELANLARAGQMPTTMRGAQQAAAKMQEQSYAQGTELAKQAGVEELQARKTSAGQARLEKAQQLSELRKSVNASIRQQEETFANLSGNIKAQVFDDQLKFQKDELNRTQFNDRQLADWALLKAKNQVELKKYEDMMRRSIERKRIVTDMAYKTVTQALQQTWTSKEQALDQQAKEDLREIAIQAQQARARAKAKAANCAGIWSTVGTVVGGVVGAVAGGIWNFGAGSAAGAVAGATIGSSVFGAVGSYVGSERAAGGKEY